jgi:uncharacterized protein DUF3489
MTTPPLSDTQRQVLERAADQADGRITWFPDGVRGGARLKVLDGLARRGLITGTEGQDGSLTAEAYTALGRVPPAPPAPQRQARTRQHSKQATVIEMLRRPEGATVGQVCAATGWQAHTVRGTFAGTFKKKLGLTLSSEKPEGGERIYRIA